MFTINVHTGASKAKQKNSPRHVRMTRVTISKVSSSACSVQYYVAICLIFDVQTNPNRLVREEPITWPQACVMEFAHELQYRLIDHTPPPCANKRFSNNRLHWPSCLSDFGGIRDAAGGLLSSSTVPSKIVLAAYSNQLSRLQCHRENY